MIYWLLTVPRTGIEPAHLAAADFESAASTNSATWAADWGCNITAFPPFETNVREIFFERSIATATFFGKQDLPDQFPQRFQHDYYLFYRDQWPVAIDHFS